MSAEVERALRGLLRDIDGSACAEIELRAFYALRAPCVDDLELRALLRSLAEEQETLIERLAALVAALGGRPRRAAWSKVFWMRVLHAVRWLFTRRLLLRMGLSTEQSLAYGYDLFAADFAALGRTAEARELQSLAQTKHGHVRALQAWIAS